MTPDRVEELWGRFLTGGEMTELEKAELLGALEKDPELRNELLGDDATDSLLRMRRWAKEPEETFTETFWHRVSAEADGKDFLQRLQPRIDQAPTARKTRRKVRQVNPFPYWPLLGVAAAAAVLILIVTTFFKPPPPRPTRPTDPPIAVVPQPPQAHDHRAVEPTVEPDLKAVERAQVEQDSRERIEQQMQAEIEKARAKLPPVEPPKPQPVVPDAPRPETPVKPTEARVALARLESLAGEVHFLAGGAKRPARVGEEIAAGEGIETVGMAARAVVVYTDKTRVELRRGTLLDGFADDVGKRMTLRKGTLWVEAAPQPKGKALVITTAQAEARVIGTKFRLEAEEAQEGLAQLEVKEGRVKLTRSSDRATVDVLSGQYAVAAPGLEMVARKGEVPPLLRDGLMAHWAFDEAAGTVVKDFSGKAKDGIPTAGQWTPGRFGHAMLFTGQQPGSGVLCQPVFNGAGAFSVSGWVRTPGKGSNQIVLHQISGPNGGEFSISVNAQGRAAWVTREGVTPRFSLLTVNSLADGKWHSLVGVREPDGTGRLYVDGKLVAVSEASMPAIINSSSLVLGGVVCCNLAGTIDDVRIYARALTPDEVTILSGGLR